MFDVGKVVKNARIQLKKRLNKAKRELQAAALLEIKDASVGEGFDVNVPDLPFSFGPTLQPIDPLRPIDPVTVAGAGPWDIKPGLLARAKFAKDGTPYVNVPVHLNRLKNVGEQVSNILLGHDFNGSKAGLRFTAAGPILFRRVSLRSPSHSWIHPGFGGDVRSEQRRFGTNYGPDLPSGSERRAASMEAWQKKDAYASQRERRFLKQRLMEIVRKIVGGKSK